LKQSELFDHIVYLSEVCDVLSIAMAELPGLLSPAEVAEALLRLKFGPTVICHIVTNQPDAFHDGEIS
jgi:integrator complex subunit 2